MRIKPFILIKSFFALALFFTYFNSYGQSIIDKDLFKQVVSEYSGEQALEHIREIARFHRVQATEGFDKAAQYVISKLKEYGIENVRLLRFYSDGKTRYGTYPSPLSWTVREGELWLEEPVKERLIRFSDIPTSLSTLSNGGEYRGSLVHVGEGTSEKDYKGKKVRDKIVYAWGYAGTVHREAVIKRGALGVIIYPGPDDRPQLLDAVRYNGLWPSWEEKDKAGFGFQISRRQAKRIQKLLDSGEKVIVSAKIDASIHPGNLEIVEVVLKGGGKVDEEFLLMAHLDHYKPGAGDNASGSAALLEVARSIVSLMDRGLVNLSGRSIRFIWVPEHFGTMAYVVNYSVRWDKMLAGLNLDMVGEDEFKTNSKLSVIRTPLSQPSFINDLVEYLVEMVDNANITSPTGTPNFFAFRVFPYTSGSDHDMFNDGSIGVPTVALGFWGDQFWHTNEDTPDKSDPTSLKRVGVIATLTALYVANAGEKEGIELGKLVSSKAVARITELSEQLTSGIDFQKGGEDINVEMAYKEAINKFKFYVDVERKAIKSVSLFQENLENKVMELISRFNEHAEIERSMIVEHFRSSGLKREEITPTKDEIEALKLIPLRKFTGPLYDGEMDPWFREKLGKDYEWYRKVKIPKFWLVRYEVPNFMNGERSILDIRNAVSAEYEPVELNHIDRIIKDLERAGLVEITEKDLEPR
ncbi:MAG: DUF4910 domain-containing protein [Fidelibacterota bacterium]